MNVYCLVFSYFLFSSFFFTPYSPPLPFSSSLTRRVYRIADGNISNAKAYIELRLAAYRLNFFLSHPKGIYVILIRHGTAVPPSPVLGKAISLPDLIISRPTSLVSMVRCRIFLCETGQFCINFTFYKINV